MKREFICIVCPKGCRIEVDDSLNVTGHGCKRGVEYVLNEIKNPKRMLTTTVKINSLIIKRLPVITSNEIPKDKIFDVMKEINKIEVSAPVKLKDVIVKNILNLGVDIVATRSISR